MLRDCTLNDATFVALNMRERDKTEIYATRHNDNPVILAGELMVMVAEHGYCWVALHKGKPAAIVGAVEMWPGVWQAIAFGTDDWRHVALTVTRWIKRVIMPTLIRRGAHRVECRSHIEHTDAHRWLRALGAEPETTLTEFGKDRSDYLLFVWRE